MRLVNIAHGDLIVLAAYVTLVIVAATGLNPLVAIVIAAPVMALFGYVLQRARLQPHARRRPPAAVAREFRPLRHHPEQPADDVQRRQPQARRGRHRDRELERRSRPLARAAAPADVRDRDRRHRRAAIHVLPHAAGPRAARDLRRPRGRAPDGLRQQTSVRNRDGAVARGRRRRGRLPRRAREFRAVRRPRAVDLRLRSP